MAPAATVKKDLKRAPLLGTVRVQVWHGVYKGPSANVAMLRDTAVLSIAEKALKGTAVSHGTRLVAQPYPAQHALTCHVQSWRRCPNRSRGAR